MPPVAKMLRVGFLSGDCGFLHGSASWLLFASRRVPCAASCQPKGIFQNGISDIGYGWGDPRGSYCSTHKYIPYFSESSAGRNPCVGHHRNSVKYAHTNQKLCAYWRWTNLASFTGRNFVMISRRLVPAHNAWPAKRLLLLTFVFPPRLDLDF